VNERGDELHPVLLRPWVAVAGGAVAGILLATAVVVAWTLFGTDTGDPGHAAINPESSIDVYRLPQGAFEMLVVPAGPDARGEELLSASLYPGEQPARAFASVLLANTGALGSWEVDLAATPLRARAGDAWFDLSPVPPERLDGLSPVALLRLRSVGGDVASAHVEPGSLRRVLLALPAGRTFRDVSAVQWGDRPLERQQMDLERLHEFRDRPEVVTR